ncbi:unnamed protein product, partial [Timema podura]|nr:unnamed protein product [Timema podura]
MRPNLRCWRVESNLGQTTRPGLNPDRADTELLFECLTSTMKCEYNEEDNERSEIFSLSIAVSTLKPSSLPFIKEEIKVECRYDRITKNSSRNRSRGSTLINGVQNCTCKQRHMGEWEMGRGVKKGTDHIPTSPPPPRFQNNKALKLEISVRKKVKFTIMNQIAMHTQLKLESTIEPILHYIIKPEITSKSPAIGGCEELDVKEEMCFDESSINVSENNKIGLRQNFNNENHKNVEFHVMDDQIMDTTFLNNETNLYQKNREKYKCHDYSKSYTNNINLKSQLLTQSDPRPHKCEVCGKFFKLISKLKTHLIIHGEHRRLKCDVCGKCFKEKGVLRSHLVTHSEHRPYKCDICSKCFKLSYHLKSHLVSHGEHRPHKC